MRMGAEVKSTKDTKRDILRLQYCVLTWSLDIVHKMCTVTLYPCLQSGGSVLMTLEAAVRCSVTQCKATRYNGEIVLHL